MTEPKHIYNLKLNSPYKHWRKLRNILLASSNNPVNLPPSYYIPVMFTPYDQGNIGSCTANSVCASIKIQSDQHADPSRLFLYYQAREKSNGLDSEGAYIDDVYNVVKEIGVCSEATWPYIISNENVKPSNQAYNESNKIRTVSWGNVVGSTTLEGIKQTLYTNRPVVLGIRVYASFESETVANTGMVPMPDKGKEKLFGGHAILAVGYDDDKKALLLVNSWGSNWGTVHPNSNTRGFCYLPYEFVQDPHLCDEAVFMNEIVLNGAVMPIPTQKMLLEENKEEDKSKDTPKEVALKENTPKEVAPEEVSTAPDGRNINDPPVGQRYQSSQKQEPVISQRYRK